MEKLIVIDSCMRSESRTKVILDAAMAVLSTRYEAEVLDVNSLDLAPLTPETLRSRCDGEVPAKAVEIAGKVASADRIVVAAPFWDMSFPSALKAFFENISLYGVTFTDDGVTCTGLCRCKHLLYITTRGMNIPDGDAREQGSTYLKALSTLWGLGDVTMISAWNLDYMSPENLQSAVALACDRARAIAAEF